MNKLVIVPLTSILAITIILCVAMLLGKNGVVLALGVAGISGLGGYEIKTLVNGLRGGIKNGKS